VLVSLYPAKQQLFKIVCVVIVKMCAGGGGAMGIVYHIHMAMVIVQTFNRINTINVFIRIEVINSPADDHWFVGESPYARCAWQTSSSGISTSR
jgi:hypothetical protein